VALEGFMFVSNKTQNDLLKMLGTPQM